MLVEYIHTTVCFDESDTIKQLHHHDIWVIWDQIVTLVKTPEGSESEPAKILTYHHIRAPQKASRRERKAEEKQEIERQMQKEMLPSRKKLY